MINYPIKISIGGPKRKSPKPSFREAQWQVLQDLAEQLVQLEEEALIRLEPPPMPKHEIIFWTSADPHSSQTTSLSLPGETRRSNLFPHFLHVYSYKGISSLFYRNSPSRSTGRAERSVMSTELSPNPLRGRAR